MKPSNLLFVCSGNTCRSAMAEVIGHAVAMDRGYDIEIRSAGVSAEPGVPASETARDVAEAHGLDLSRHAARRLSEGDLDWADMVLGMTYAHIDLIRRQAPGLLTLPVTGFLAHDHPGAGLEVDDPYGGSMSDYEIVWSTLEDAIGVMFDRLCSSEADD